MRKDWWLVIILVLCLALLVGILYCGESAKVQLDKSNLADKGEDFDVGSNDDVGGSGGGSGGVSGDGVVVGDAVVPDVDAAECGFYFERYGVCAGTCPGGECVSEGRSCYCKKT